MLLTAVDLLLMVHRLLEDLLWLLPQCGRASSWAYTVHQMRCRQCVELVHPVTAESMATAPSGGSGFLNCDVGGGGGGGVGGGGGGGGGTCGGSLPAGGGVGGDGTAVGDPGTFGHNCGGVVDDDAADAVDG